MLIRMEIRISSPRKDRRIWKPRSSLRIRHSLIIRRVARYHRNTRHRRLLQLRRRVRDRGEEEAAYQGLEVEAVYPHAVVRREGREVAVGLQEEQLGGEGALDEARYVVLVVLEHTMIPRYV